MAESALLGAVLQDSRLWRSCADIVSGDDFLDARLGKVFDGIGLVLASGGGVSSVDVWTFYPDWGVRGLDAASAHAWVMACEAPFRALGYANAVRAASGRVRTRNALQGGLGMLEDAGVSSDDVALRVVQDLRAQESKQVMTTSTLADLDKLVEKHDWVVPGLFERQDRLILTGFEGSGKSTWMRQALILPAAGLHPLTFETIEPVKALAIDAENTAMQWKRQAGWIRHLANKHGSVDPGLNVHIATAGRVNILDPRVLGNIHRLIDEHSPDMVFIGPLYRLAVKMNNDDDVAPVIAALDTIRDRGVVLLMEAHAGHAQNSSGVRDVRPRGSSALMGWPEFGFGLRVDAGTVGTSLVEYDFVPWRGMREERGFPEKFRRGVKGEFPWVALN